MGRKLNQNKICVAIAKDDCLSAPPTIHSYRKVHAASRSLKLYTESGTRRAGSMRGILDSFE